MCSDNDKRGYGMRKRNIQTTIYDVLFEEERALLKEEYANLRKKQSEGYMNANFFRRNMFNATARGERIQYKRPKIVWEKTKTNKVAISHSLHQKHADVLSLIHTDHIMVSKPDSNGGYSIYLSLYAIAKAMGYKYPSKSTDKVKQFITDLRWTDFIIYTKDGEYRTTILDDAFYSEQQDVYIVSIKGKSAKILAHTTGIRISKELTHKIVSIPDNLVKLKAMVRYIISNKPTTNGYTMDFIFDKFDIGKTGNLQVQRNSKSEFRKQLKDKGDLLKTFNLKFFGDEDKIYYLEQLKQVEFELAVNQKPQKIIDKIEASKIEEIEYPQIGKKILIDDIVFEVVDILLNDNGTFDFKLKDIAKNAIGTAKNNTLESLNRLIEEFIDPSVRSMINRQ
jgi:hypothetical protein